MSPEPLKTLPPRRLLLVGIIALVAAGAIAANGHHRPSRATAGARPVDQRAGDPDRRARQAHARRRRTELILPGDIQPYHKAAIYSRGSAAI